MNEIIDKSTRFSQVCQLLLSLIVFGACAKVYKVPLSARVNGLSKVKLR